MTLRRKMALQILAIVIGLLSVSAALLSGMARLEDDYADAFDGLEEIRRLYEIESQLTIAKRMLNLSPPDRVSAIEHVDKAGIGFKAAVARAGGDGVRDKSVQAVDVALRRTLSQLREWKIEDGTAPVDTVVTQITDTIAVVRPRVEASRQEALSRRNASLVSLAILCGGVIMAAILLASWQYRSVLNPLRRLSGAVRRVATGQFGVRIMEAGVPGGANNEFAQLAADFNRMATQLDSFYKDLEQKVAAKSKELIRSERLASVGYLAAGVAHEINNPLGIISGYAEYALAEMRSGSPTAATEIDSTLKVIRDEAFRCKDITSKLLSLARPGDGQRQRVNLADVAENVVSMLGGLRGFKQRTITVRANSRESLFVNAVEGEMKQVLMNLLINALEATEDSEGEVKVTVAPGEGQPSGKSVTLAVSDNGRGMPAETLEHVFEPFFTDRPRRDLDSPPRPGTGLGLSITHAIVQSHAGRITAHSEGQGKGSRFVIDMPAAREVEV